MIHSTRIFQHKLSGLTRNPYIVYATEVEERTQLEPLKRIIEKEGGIISRVEKIQSQHTPRSSSEWVTHSISKQLYFEESYEVIYFTIPGEQPVFPSWLLAV